MNWKGATVLGVLFLGGNIEIPHVGQAAFVFLNILFFFFSLFLFFFFPFLFFPCLACDRSSRSSLHLDSSTYDLSSTLCRVLSKPVTTRETLLKQPFLSPVMK